MTKTGEALGVELGQVYEAGRKLLPEVADDVHTAYMSTPMSASWLTGRGGGLGHDPGSRFDSLLDLLNQAARETEQVVRAVGIALVQTAEDYDRMDEEARRVFEEKKRRIG